MSTARSSASRIYDILLAVFGGSALGWFAWWFLDGYGSGSRIPYVVYAIAGIALAFWLILIARRRSPSGRSWAVHLLWIPAVLFVLLMAAVLVALRNWQ
jgi:hypothetical protein